MRHLSSAQLLAIWDEESHHSPVQKAVRLVSDAFTEGNDEAAARLSIGQRDACLLYLREQMFGTRLRNLANCPHCGELIEWESNTTDFKLQHIPDTTEAQTFSIDQEGYRVRFRLPDSMDIAMALSRPEYRDDPRRLLMDCILEVQCGEDTLRVEDLPDAVLDLVHEQMAIEDPQANIRINVQCPACAQTAERNFDILSFFWSEIQHWALRLLQDICLLARNFGWSEKEILALSPQRRQTYIQLITA